MGYEKKTNIFTNPSNNSLFANQAYISSLLRTQLFPLNDVLWSYSHCLEDEST